MSCIVSVVDSMYINQGWCSNSLEFKKKTKKVKKADLLLSIYWDTAASQIEHLIKKKNLLSEKRKTKPSKRILMLSS